MAEPIAELIAQNIKAAIESVNAGEVVEGNAYHYTLKPLRPLRVDYENVKWNNHDVIIRQMDSGPSAAAQLRVRRVLNFALSAICIDSIDSSTTIDTHQNRVAADIEKALQVDTTRGGYALFTEVGDAVPFESDELELTGILIDVAVHYSIMEKDPYTNG